MTKPINLKAFKQLISSKLYHEVVIKAEKEGFSINIESQDRALYVLYTKRDSVRFFKAPNTVINFISELGVEGCRFTSLTEETKNTYVNQNSK